MSRDVNDPAFIEAWERDEIKEEQRMERIVEEGATNLVSKLRDQLPFMVRVDLQALIEATFRGKKLPAMCEEYPHLAKFLGIR